MTALSTTDTLIKIGIFVDLNGQFILQKIIISTSPSSLKSSLFYKLKRNADRGGL